MGFWCMRGGNLVAAAVARDARHAAMIQEVPLKKHPRGVVAYFLKSARAEENKANQQCHFKSSQRRMDPLDADSCRGTVPMEPPMSNSSMQHRELLKWNL